MRIEATPPGWIEAVMCDFDSFLKDHASCEKKASGMALNIASHYPDKPKLLAAMADLAVEELTHYREVVRVLLERGIEPGADTRDPYVRGLNALIRQGQNYLLDRLLVAAIVERRGSERFGLIANALGDDPLAAFYRAITVSEARHWQLFVDLAHTYSEAATVADRLDELCGMEADLITTLPFRAALH
ncbi:MAG: tRNA-(ms[2]io[6]A)-hydroxylase [Pseudomonadales bacterium]